MNNRAISILKYVLGWPFSILAFIFILRIILPKIPEFSSSIQKLNFPLLAAAIGCFFLFYLVRSYIWHRLLKAHSDKITYKKAAFGWAISEVRRYIPGNFWGLLGRTLTFSAHGIKKKDTGKLVMLEAGIFTAGALIFSIVSIPFIAKYLFPQFNNFPQILIFMLVVTLLIAYLYNHKIFRFLPAFSVQENIHLLFLSIISVMFFGLGSYFAISSIVVLPMQLLFQLSGFFVLSLLLGFSSLLTPAGFGVREGIIISGLSKLIPFASAALTALFARIVLIVSELIFIIFTFIFYKIKSKKILSIERWISNNKHEAALIFLVLIYILYFTLVTFLRHDNFYTGRFDLGNMAQTVWNTTQGRVFQFTNPHGTEVISRLAFHADFLLILIAPIYALFPSPKTLLFMQTVVVALGGVFIYLIAKNKLNDKNISLALAFSYLISPSVQRTNMYDFHAVTLATTFLLGTYYFYSRKKYVYFLIFAFLSAISKEQIWLIVALFGGLVFLKHKMRIFGAVIFFVSLFMFYYLVSIAIPTSLGASHFALNYYSEFGDGPVDVIRNIIFSPKKIIGIVFEKDRINYLVQIFSHVGYLPIFFPLFLIFALPDLMINLLSNNAQLHQIYYHYTAAITPFIYLSTIFALSLFFRLFPKKLYIILTFFVLSTAIMSAYKYGPLPGSKDTNIDMFTKQVNDRRFIMQNLSNIPSDLSVASSNNLGAHLIHRKILYTLPLGLEEADVVAFLLSPSEQPDSLNIQKIQVEGLRKNPKYEIVAEKGSFVIFRRK